MRNRNPHVANPYRNLYLRRSRLVFRIHSITLEKLHFGKPEDMVVGVVAVGYGDGYPRHAPSGTPVLINGIRVPLIGRVSMDMITVDLRTLPEAQIGDPVVLWGDGLPVEEIAEMAGTISYELLCGITQRVVVREIDESG